MCLNSTKPATRPPSIIVVVWQCCESIISCFLCTSCYHKARMASQNRIWTLNDVSNHQSVPEAASVGGGKNPPRTSSQHDEGTAPPLEDPLASKFCQPVAKPKDNVPLHHISNLLSEHVCRDTLQRIHNEFFLIVQRRGYNVLTISEFCCCGDGLDQLPRRRRKLKKQHNNVLGYNSTRFGKTKSHTIHLRLRDARNHNQLLPWEDIAGTMAHELSHCVHQNHGPGFYKLMEEILEGTSYLLHRRASSCQHTHIFFAHP
jgi:hypothetical protein